MFIEKATPESLSKPWGKVNTKTMKRISAASSSRSILMVLETTCKKNGVQFVQHTNLPYGAFEKLLKSWVKKHVPPAEFVDNHEYLEYVVTNWMDICCGLKAQHHKFPFLNNPYIFNTFYFFERPLYNVAIRDYIVNKKFMSRDELSLAKFFKDEIVKRHGQELSDHVASTEAHPDYTEMFNRLYAPASKPVEGA